MEKNDVFPLRHVWTQHFVPNSHILRSYFAAGFNLFFYAAETIWDEVLQEKLEVRISARDKVERHRSSVDEAKKIETIQSYV